MQNAIMHLSNAQRCPYSVGLHGCEMQEYFKNIFVEILPQEFQYNKSSLMHIPIIRYKES